MLDRFGSPGRVGWPEHSILWLEAALTLPRDQHSQAFQDIADMTGRTLNAVRFKAYALLTQRLDVRIADAAAIKKAQHAAMLARRTARLCGLPPSQIPAPSMARLMGARA